MGGDWSVGVIDGAGNGNDDDCEDDCGDVHPVGLNFCEWWC